MATGIQKHNIYILYKLQKYENKKCFISIPKCSITEGSAYIFCKIQNVYFTTSPLPYSFKIECLQNKMFVLHHFLSHSIHDILKNMFHLDDQMFYLSIE